uniref:Decaprenyl-diphosphate synthase subunit 2 n=1 Tax=Phallusia mammillata TaxID=59560 RepID=A0A6F9DMW2_9ASCI|nr:decaprenyl-diphosphate synthase subunit 2 [Phallusia mammillata]
MNVATRLLGRKPNSCSCWLKCSYSFQSITNGLTKDSNQAINKAVYDAEKIVGFPTSFLSLRALLSNELSAVALHLRKLVRTNHPLIKTARGMLFDSKHNVQVRGLVVLLLSKAIADKDGGIEASEIYSRHRSLAELTELIHTAFLIHRGLVDVETLLKVDSKNSRGELELGNKMAVLSGDFLLANACVALSELKNSKVVDLMSSSISDMSHGFFVLPESGEFSHITSLEDLPMSLTQWRDIMYLAHGSLLSNACRASVQLAGKSVEYGNTASEFGKHLILAQLANFDLQRVNNGNGNNGQNHNFLSEICMLPVVLAAEQNNGQKWMEQFLENEGNEYKLCKDKLLTSVKQNTKAMEDADQTRKCHRNLALQSLSELPLCEERTSLELLTNAFAGS